MPNPVFPIDVRPRIGWRTSLQDARVRSTTDAGPPKMRARFSAAITNHDVTLSPVRTDQLATLLTFYKTTLSQGSTSFDWRDEQNVVTTFRFREPPNYRCLVGHRDPTQRLYEVDLALEALP